MPAPELALWREYHQRYGFEADRIAWTVAKAGAALCRIRGAKINPKDLLPSFVVQRGMSIQAIRAELVALPGARVEKVDAAELARRQKASRTI